MKLLFLAADKFPPFRVDVAVLFAQELAGRGHEIEWILQAENENNGSYKTLWHGNPVWVGATDNGLSFWHRLKKHFFDFKNDFRVFKLATINDYDFIQVKDKFLTAIIAIIAAKKNDSTFIYWLSYPFPEASLIRARNGTARYPFFYFLRGYFFTWLLYKIILPRAGHVFVQSEQMKSNLHLKGISLDKMTSVPMSISFQEVLAVQRKPLASSGSSSDPVILYLGTLARVRKLEFLLEVLVQVKKRVANARLYFVGDGNELSDRRFLQAEAERLGVNDSVVFTGFVPMEKAWEYIRLANVCVSPMYPSFILNCASPTKLIEYLAFGKPVVVNEHPEQSIILAESKSGYCVPYDVGAFATAIIKLLKNPQKAESMGKNGREYVKKSRDYPAIAAMVENKYQQILANFDKR